MMIRSSLFRLQETDKIILKKIRGKLKRELIENLIKTKTAYLKNIRDYQKAIHLHRKGLGPRKIAKILHRPRSTIESWIYRGMKPVYRLKVPKRIIQKLKSDANLTNKEIAKILKIKPKSVYYGYIKPGKKEGKKFLPSEASIKHIKQSSNSTEFLDYFWKETSQKELENFSKYCKFIKLKNDLPPFELARKIEKSYSTVFKWRKNKCAPNLLRWLELYLKLGKPKENHVWLFLNLGLNGVPISQPIQVPKNINNWQDIENVIDQLESLNNNELLVNRMSKRECFGFALGMIVGDAMKHGSHKDSIHLALTKRYETNELLGNFFCQCLRKLGLIAGRKKGYKNNYKWISQSSPFFNWVYKVILGLEVSETTTFCPIKADWLLDSPPEVVRRFLQGIFESDGSVDYEGGIRCAAFANVTLIQNLLKRYGIKSYTTKVGKWKLLELGGLPQLKKLHGILFVPEIKTKKCQIIEKIINARKVKGTGGRLPQGIRKKIKDMINKGFKTYVIIKRILLDENYFVSRSTVEHYKGKMRTYQEENILTLEKI
jgi:transposase